MEDLNTLVIDAQRGSVDAFNQLVRRFQDMAVGYAYTLLRDFHLAEDAAQEAFIGAYLDLPRLRQPAAFAGWLRRLVFMRCTRVTRGKRPEVVPLDWVGEIAAQAPDPLERIVAGELSKQVHQAMQGLVEAERQAITLFYISSYSYEEIAAFLEVPITTVQKRLFDARKHLKERVSTMVHTQLRESRPSQNNAFSRRVQFFVALKTEDLPTMEGLLKEDPDLTQAKTDWEVAPDSFWPRDITPIFWAAKTGNEAVLKLLLKHGAIVDARINTDETPLHYAVLAGHHHLARVLLAEAADVQAAANTGQTPLHRAVFRGDREMIELLLSAGAKIDAEDHGGKTPADWAALKNRPDLVDLLVSHGARRPAVSVPVPAGKARSVPRREVPAGDAVLGRMLDGTGNPLDGLGDFPDPTRQPVFGSIKAPPSPILETGIKALDLFAPFKRGGQVGVDLCLGVGRLILMEQIARNGIALHDSRVVYLGLSEGGPPAIQYSEWWDASSGDGKVLRENMVFVLGQTRDSVSKRQQVAETGLTLAEAFRQQGHDVLLIVEGRLALTEAVVPYLRSYAAATPEAAITTLYLGDPPVGLESEVFADLDAAVIFDPVRARQGMYPAIDPVSSWSTLLQSNLLSSAHKELAARARECLHRYYSWNLHHAYEARGLDCLYIDDGKATAQGILRARRLDRFLTQPFHGTERWLCVPGETVSIEDTLRSCQEILDGEHDDLPENAFYFVGTIEQALEKAKNL